MCVWASYLNGFWRQRAVELLAAIGHDHMLNIQDQLSKWSSIMIRDGAQSCMLNQPVIREMQILREAWLRDLIDLRDIRDGHPRVHSRYIAGLNTLVILLKMLIGPDCASGGEAC